MRLRNGPPASTHCWPPGDKATIENLIEGAQDAAADNGWELDVQILSPEEDVSQALSDADGSADLIALATVPRPIFSFRIWQRRLHCWEPTATRSPVYSIYDTTMMGNTTGGNFRKFFGLQKTCCWLSIGPNILPTSWRNRFLEQVGAQGTRIPARGGRQSDPEAMESEITQTLAVNPAIDSIICTTQNGTCAALRAVERYGRFVPILAQTSIRRSHRASTTGTIRASIVTQQLCPATWALKTRSAFSAGRASRKPVRWTRW